MAATFQNGKFGSGAVRDNRLQADVRATASRRPSRQRPHCAPGRQARSRPRRSRGPRGEITAVLAPSGAGKSTLLRACVRLFALDSGSVTLDEVDVTGLDARALRRRVGLVAQHPVMLPGTVADNLRHGVDELSEDALGRALDDAGLDGSSRRAWPASCRAGSGRAWVSHGR